MGLWLGVDLGTTYVAAALAGDAGAAEMFSLGDRSVAVPSVVHLRADGVMLVAEAADRREVGESGRTAREFKRRLGDPTPMRLGGVSYRPVELMAAALADVLRRVEETEGRPPTGVVLTHPANWGPYRRSLFAEVPELAGLGPVEVITEPEAAAHHHATTRDLAEGAVVAVYDLGGGTFDATVVRKRADRLELLGVPEGIERLGGVDFDQAVFEHVDHTSDGAISGLDRRDPRVRAALARLRRDCVLAKEMLSVEDEAVVPVFLPDRHFEVTIDRKRFEELIRARVESTVGALERALRSAGVTPEELDAVLLVGGSARIPLVGQVVGEALGRPVAADTHPKYAVALGAAAVASRGPGRGGGAPVVSAPPAAPPVGASARVASGAGLSRRVIAVSGLAVAAAVLGMGVWMFGGDPEVPPPPPVQPSNGPTVIATIAVGGTPNLIELTPDGSRLYGLDRLGTDKSVSWFACDTAGNTRIAGGSLAAGGNNMAVSTDGDAYFTASLGTQPVLSVIDSATNTETDPVRVAPTPSGLDFGPEGRYLYLTHIRGFVTVFDLATRTTVATIPGIGKAHVAKVSPDGSRLYVSGNGVDTVSAIDTASNMVIWTVPAAAPFGLAVSPDGRTVYVAQRRSRSVAVIDVASRSVTAVVQVGESPGGVALTPDGDRLYVADQDSGTVSVIDTGAG
jgi:YVTN family beta-propeller protein